MKKFLKRLWQNEKGFTLIELIIVIAILAIIAAVAIPNLLKAVDNSRRTTDVANAKIIADTVATVRVSDEDYSGVVGMYNVSASGGAFSDDVFAELSNVAITPKFKGAATWDENVFFYILNADGAVTVYTSDAEITEDTTDPWTLPTNRLQVYPLVAGSAYENQ